MQPSDVIEESADALLARLGLDASTAGAMLAQRGRNAFLGVLRERGVPLAARSALADALIAATREGRLTWSAVLSAEFEAAALAMPLPVRQLLVENADPNTVTAANLLMALDRPVDDAHKGGLVMHLPAALSPKACAALRSAVDCERRVARDSVDGGPEHQLNLSLSALGLLIGAEAVGRLMRAPGEYRKRTSIAVSCTETKPRSQGELAALAAALRVEAVAMKRCGDACGALEKLHEARGYEQQLAAGGATDVSDTTKPHGAHDHGEHGDVHAADTGGDGGGGEGGVSELRELFVRRYSLETRPWIAFHPDAYELTLNVALSADADHSGGRLLAVCDGHVQSITRAEGEATVHSSKLLHAVSRMSGGTRYSLIAFFDRRERAGRHDRWTQPSAGGDAACERDP